MFDNDAGDPGTYQNEPAHDACIYGAEASYSACLNDADRSALYSAWITFTARLRRCLEEFPDDEDESQQACISGALVEYRHTVEDLIPDDDDDCTSGGIYLSSFGTPRAVGPLDTLRRAAIDRGYEDGEYRVQANTSLTITAGVNATPGSGYDIREYGCLKQALLLGVSYGKEGVRVEFMDADTDLIDGVEFDVHIFADKLVHTDELGLLCVYFNQHDVPKFGEFGKLKIEPTDVGGDWNRDRVSDTRDVIDFLDSYSAGTKRADLNGDDRVDSEDAEAFTDSMGD